jgi:hypothetical protein
MIQRGTTRTVLSVGPLAFKFGRGEYGARCNRYEAELYARSRSKRHRQSMLCPVLWCSRSGQLLIARRAATPVTPSQLAERKAHAWDEWNYEGHGDDECPFEYGKPTDWGCLDGRLSAVFSGSTRRVHIGALQRGHSGRPQVISSDEWPLLTNAIFRLQRSGESATVSQPLNAFNGAKHVIPSSIKTI